jgi:hypothetical protein
MFNYDVMDHGFKLKCNMEPQKIQALQNQSPCVYKSPIGTTHRMYSHVKGTILISFVLVAYVDMDTHDIVPIVMTIGRLTTMVFASTTLPPNVRPSKRFSKNNKEICSTIYSSL